MAMRGWNGASGTPRAAPRGAVRAGLPAALGIAGMLLGGLALVGAERRGAAEQRLDGPVPAQVVAVLDGDTIEVRARIWLGQEVTTRVRLAGLDAPERTGRCDRERALAARAEAFVRDRIAAAPGRVLLRDVRFGKYAGRVLARVETAAGEDLGEGLIAAGLARPYAGRARAGWCAGPGPAARRP